MTDPRLDEALARAAASVQILRGDEDETLRRLGKYLAGWAEAIRALREAQKVRLATDDWQRKCVKQAHGDSHMRCGECFLCLERKAIRRFCDTMLGKEKTDR